MKTEKHIPIPRLSYEEQTVIVFGTRLLADNWARANHTDPKMVILATEPEKVQGRRGPFVIVRFPKDVWQPPTFPCEKRVRETEDWIVKDQALRTR